MKLKVFICGEGPSDIGRWARQPEYREQYDSHGLIGAIARKVADGEWEICDGLVHKNVPAYRANRIGDSGEVRKLFGAIEMAREAGCDVLLFARDIDGQQDRSAELRRAAVDLEARGNNITAVALVDPCIEGWALELLGERSKHGWRKTAAKEQLALRWNSSIEGTAAEWDGKTEPLSDDLKLWLDDVKRVLSSADASP